MFQNLQEINSTFPWFFATVVFIFGACWGSFLNVVIYRVPRKLSVVTPRSFCTTSNKPIPWYDNIPLLSWLLLRGKSRHDGSPISARYPAVELLTAVLFLALWLLQPPAIALIGFPFIALLIAGTFIDLEHMILPDFCTIWGMLAGVALAFAFPAMHAQSVGEPFFIESLRSGLTAIIGVLIGSGVILWIAMLAETILKREAMGFGDVLFMGCIGAFCGWQGALFSIFGGALLGTLVVIPLMLIQALFGIKTPKPGRVENRTIEEVTQAEAAAEAARQQGKTSEAAGASAEAPTDEDLRMGTAIPFGPWLALGAAVYYIALREPVNLYFDNLTQLFFGTTW